MKLRKEVSRVSIELIEIAGFPAFLESLRIPFKREVRSEYSFHLANNPNPKPGFDRFSQTGLILDPRDLKLASSLKTRGDEHAKSIRMITVDCSINAPLWFWQEMVTYEVGVTKGCSESTMHCECAGMKAEELEAYKDGIISGHMQKRIYKFSYQTLRRIYLQRKSHRLPSWQAIIQFIEELPFAKELILFSEKDV